MIRSRSADGNHWCLHTHTTHTTKFLARHNVADLRPMRVCSRCWLIKTSALVVCAPAVLLSSRQWKVFRLHWCPVDGQGQLFHRPVSQAVATRPVRSLRRHPGVHPARPRHLSPDGSRL
jgi:hypothetical protein